MKFGVVTFPGSNCDEDMIYVLENIMGMYLIFKSADTDLLNGQSKPPPSE